MILARVQTILLLCLLFLVPSTNHAAAGGLLTPYLVTLHIDNVGLRKIYRCYKDKQGKLWMAGSDLSEIHFPASPQEARLYKGQDYYLLDSYENIAYDLDEQRLILHIQTPVTWHNNVIGAEVPLENQDLRPSRPGVFLNYDINDGYYGFPNNNHTAAFTEAGLFTPFGVGTSGFLYNGNDYFRLHNKIVRLETTWTLDQPEHIASWRFGDSINSGFTWNGAVRFAGIQYATNFATQPAMITFPQPSLRGEANIPSSIDILVNGVPSYHQEVNKGVYSLNQIPVTTGAGTMQIITTDLLGRQAVNTFVYYASPTLLKPGLSNYSFEIGKIRRAYTFENNNYGRALGVGTWSMGFTDRLTAGVHVELLKDQQNLGFSNNYLLGSLGILHFGAAGSRACNEGRLMWGNIKRGWGGLVNMGFTRQSSFLSYGFQANVASSDYIQLGSFNSLWYPNLTLQSFIGMNMGRAGSLSATYTSLNNALLNNYAFLNALLDPNLNTPWPFAQSNAELLLLSYSNSIFKRAYITISALEDMKHRNNRQIFASLIMPLDKGNKSISVNEYSQNNQHQENIQLNKNLPFGNGYGFHLTGATNSSSPITSEVDIQTNQGLFGARYLGFNGVHNTSLSARGSIIGFGHRIFPARYVDQAFALVQIPRFKNIGVNSRNQLVGKTNKRGYVYIPELLAYQPNVITINTDNLPLNSQIPATSKTVVPYRKSGVLVEFDVTLVQHVLLTLNQESGEPVPAGAVVYIADNTTPLPVGYHGQVFISNDIKDTVHGRAEWDGLTCSFVLEAKHSDKVIRRETLVCHKGY